MTEPLTREQIVGTIQELPTAEAKFEFVIQHLFDYIAANQWIPLQSLTAEQSGRLLVKITELLTSDKRVDTIFVDSGVPIDEYDVNTDSYVPTDKTIVESVRTKLEAVQSRLMP